MADISSYIAAVEDPQFTKYCLSEAGVDQLWLDAVKSEVTTGLNLLRNETLEGKRLLEVGAGSGLLSILLHKEGFDVTALDPAIAGFEPLGRLAGAMRRWFHAESLPFLAMAAAQLDPQQHGHFDLIFSVNVLEHIPDLETAFRAIASVLSRSGKMVHTCPNYMVPYEPHYRIPLVPVFPRLTAFFKAALRQDELWRSLNFVTYRRIVRCAAAAGLKVRFAAGTMAEAFLRLDSDPMFRERQRGLVTRLYSVLRRAGLMRAIAAVPFQLATPMRFECYKA
jgi:2-polyprenyl-3-methyl-5-hydroxy-6-metoxy-1,4-benzoquinol methylase